MRNSHDLAQNFRKRGKERTVVETESNSRSDLALTIINPEFDIILAANNSNQI